MRAPALWSRSAARRSAAKARGCRPRIVPRGGFGEPARRRARRALDPPAQLDPRPALPRRWRCACPASRIASSPTTPPCCANCAMPFPADIVHRAGNGRSTSTALFDGVGADLALAGGGSLHIEEGRAAVLIDVDTGTPETGSAERTALAVNLAAAAVIARQLRLRSSAAASSSISSGSTTAPGASGCARPWQRHWPPIRHSRRSSAGPGSVISSWCARAASAARRGVARIRARQQPGENRAHRRLRSPACAAPRRTGAAGAAPAAGRYRRVAAAFDGDAAPALRALEGRLGHGIAVAADPSFARTRFEIVPL